MIYFTVALSMTVFADISKEALPKRRICFNKMDSEKHIFKTMFEFMRTQVP